MAWALPADLTLEEALQSVGAELDEHRISDLELTLDSSGILVGRGGYTFRQYKWGQLADAAGTRLPPEAYHDPAALTRWAVLLGLIGHCLAPLRAQHYSIAAAVARAEDLSGCQVEVRSDTGAVVLTAELVREALLRRRLRSSPPPAPASPPRRGWAWWRGARLA